MSLRSAPGLLLPIRLTAAGACLAILAAATPVTASGGSRAADRQSPDSQELRRLLQCQRVADRCVGIRPSVPIGESGRPVSPVALGGSAPAPSADIAVPATAPAGPACPGPQLPDPVRDDWCEHWVTKRGLGPQGVTEVPYTTTASPDGTELYVLAYAATSSDPPGAAILVFDAANGNWRRTLPIPWRFLGSHSEFYPYLLAADGKTIFVGGFVEIREETSEGFARHANFLTAAYTLTGELQWWSRYQGPMSGKGAGHGDWPSNLVLSPDGSQVILAGVSTRPGPFQRDPIFNREFPPDDVATVSYDAATGAQRWVQRFDSGKLEFPWGVALTPAGDGLYVNTMSWRFESTVLAYRGLDTEDGPQLGWSHAEDPTVFLAPSGIAATSQGVFVAGLSLANPSNTLDYGVVALDPDGGVRWRSNYSNVYTIAGTEYTATDVTMAMVADDDRVYVTGYAYEWDALYGAGDPSPAMVPSTVAIDARNGSLSWARTYRFPGHRIHFPMNLHLDENRLVVPGYDSECNFYVPNQNYYCKSTTINLVTLDYDAGTGALQGVGRFSHARAPTGAAVLNPSPPTAPGFNLIGPSTIASTGGVYLTAYFDAPCLDTCWPGAAYRLGILAYA